MTVHTDASTSELLASLGLVEENSGAFDGAWIQTHGERHESLDPSTGEPIAAVRFASVEDYECVAQSSSRAFEEWRTWPAPKRGEVVRQLGAGAAREQGGPRPSGHPRGRQDPQRGSGRSAGDDRHGRLRGRPVAPALRPDDALRAAPAPHVRAVASARRRSASSPPSTSRSRSGPGTRMLAAVCGDSTIWKPSHQTPLAPSR